MMAKPMASVVIVSWNTSALLRMCLDSLAGSCAGGSVEVVVVDNGSSDGSPGLVASDYPKAMLVETGSNLGYAKAINRGVNSCTADFVCLLNSDTAMTEGSLETMVGYLRSHPDVGLVGPALFNLDGSPQSSRRFFPFLSRFGARFFAGPATEAPDQPESADWLVGACLVLPRGLLQSLGGMDEDYPFYGEDMDVAYRVHRERLDVVLHPAARVIHVAEGSSRSAPTPLMRVRSRYEAPLRFLLKHGNPADVWFWRSSRGMSAGFRYLRSRFVQRGAVADYQRAVWARVVQLCVSGSPGKWSLETKY
jgi:N-acetylglucosaminyl-diphospho-decaprenol L-rhamnosyltransferase